LLRNKKEDYKRDKNGEGRIRALTLIPEQETHGHGVVECGTAASAKSNLPPWGGASEAK